VKPIAFSDISPFHPRITITHTSGRHSLLYHASDARNELITSEATFTNQITNRISSENYDEP